MSYYRRMKLKNTKIYTLERLIISVQKKAMDMISVRKLDMVS